MQINKTEDGTMRLEVGQALGAQQAREVWELLQKAEGSPLTIDAAATDHVGAQCLQLLLSAKHLWEKQGHAFRVETSEAFSEALTVCGLTDEFTCAEGAA